MRRRSRSRAPKQTEGAFKSLPPDQSFTAVFVGFDNHWLDLDGDGKKQPSGRVRIKWWPESQQKEEFQFGDGAAFTTFAQFVVIMGEHAGERMGRPVDLKPLAVDPLGQSWYWDLGESSDSQFVKTLTRIMRAAGFEIEPDKESPWMAEANEYIEIVTAQHPFLELPQPTQEEIEEYEVVDDDGNFLEPLPGMTREHVLMGICKILAERLPIVKFQTYTKTTGRVGIKHDSIMAEGAAEQRIFRAEMAKNDEVLESVNRQTWAVRNGVVTPLSDSTPGMWLYKIRDDLAGMPIPFESLSEAEMGPPEQVIAKEAMWDYTKRLYAKADTDARQELATELFDKYGLDLSKKGKLTDLPWPRASAAFVTVIGVIGNPDVKIRVDELTVIQDAGAGVPLSGLPGLVPVSGLTDDGGELPDELA
jgi:hypothetical protein